MDHHNGSGSIALYRSPWAAQNDAEKRLGLAVRTGKMCELALSAKLPSAGDAKRRVRADFLRFLLLGGDSDSSVHAKGIQLTGAWITGLLDLDECEVKHALRLYSCVLDEGLRFTDASLETFALEGCLVRCIPKEKCWSGYEKWAIFGDRAHARGSVFFRWDTCAEGLTRMQAAQIDGDLDLSGSTFQADDNGHAIDLTAIDIKGDLELNGKFEGLLPGVWDDVQVVRRLDARGQVLLDNAKIGMRLRIIGARMNFVLGKTESVSLLCRGLTCEGGFFFHHNFSDSQSGGIAGVFLLGARVAVLIDDGMSWKHGKGLHRFDGFAYARIADESRRVYYLGLIERVKGWVKDNIFAIVAVESPHPQKIDRVDWLMSQRPADLGRGEKEDDRGFRPQPWLHAAKVLEDVGEAWEARRIRISLARQALRSGGRWKRPDIHLLNVAYYWLCGSGYGYIRLAGITFVVWLLGVWAAGHLAAGGNFAPSNVAVAKDYVTECTGSYPFTASCRTGRAKSASAPDIQYPVLNPWLYSLTPILDKRLCERAGFRWRWPVR